MLQLGQQPTYPVRDDDAYWERLAIILESWPADADRMEPYRLANACACETRYAQVATAALLVRWVPLMEWMVEVSMKHGAQIAVELWFEIQEKVEAEREMRGMRQVSYRVCAG